MSGWRALDARRFLPRASKAHFQGRYEVLHVLPRFMNRIITQRELRTQSATVLREVEAGQTAIVSRNGTRVAELRPIRPRQFELRSTLAAAQARSPRIDAQQFRTDLDAFINQTIDG